MATRVTEAALVSRVSRLRGSRARALLSLNLKKRRDCWQSIKELKTHFLQGQRPSEEIYSQIPARKRPVYHSVFCVYSNFKHLLAGISEYFTLCRGQPCINVSLTFVFSGNFSFETGLLETTVVKKKGVQGGLILKQSGPNSNTWSEGQPAQQARGSSGHKKKRAREKETRPLRVSLVRVRSLFRPLLPSSCTAGYQKVHKEWVLNTKMYIPVQLGSLL